jgi:hypothetical protein
MFDFALDAHSWIRWVALIAGLLAIFTAFTSGASGKADRWGLLFMIVMDIQLLFGLALYLALSPTTAAIFGDFGAAMRDPVARFWAVEHITLMLLAIVMAHLGRILARKARTPESRRKRMLMCFTLSMVLMLAGIPWPGMRAGRALFP